MPIVLNFHAHGGSLDQYQQILDGLGSRHLAPEGRIAHAASATPGGFHVIDLWRSREEFERFAEHLGPLIAATGLSTVPEFAPCHHAILHNDGFSAPSPVTAIFEVAGSLAQYDAVRAKLDIEHEAPNGRRLHICHPSPGGFNVTGVWDSEDHLRAYLPGLRAHTAAAGLTAVPRILALHRLVTHFVL